MLPGGGEGTRTARGDRALLFYLPVRAPLGRQMVGPASSSERDISQLDCLHKNAVRSGNDVPPGTVTGMSLHWRGQRVCVMMAFKNIKAGGKRDGLSRSQVHLESGRISRT